MCITKNVDNTNIPFLQIVKNTLEKGKKRLSKNAMYSVGKIWLVEHIQ